MDLTILLFILDWRKIMAIQFPDEEKISRNEPCPCSSGLKFKKCHGDIVKQEKCREIANIYMLELIEEEKQKHLTILEN